MPRPDRTSRAAERPAASSAPSGADWDAPPALLKALHLMNADGSVSADMRRKLKQVGHLVRLFRPSLERLLARDASPLVWEFSCGSSYLGLLLLQEARATFGAELRFHGIDHDPGRVDACRRRARDAGFPDADFIHATNAAAELGGRPGMVVALHACDTATDGALLRALGSDADEIAVVPCCHRELRRLLRAVPPHDRFLHDGIIADDYCALLTDAARAARLRAAGYRTEIIEFVPLEHTARNRLIRGVRTKSKDASAAAELESLVAACTTLPSFAASA